MILSVYDLDFNPVGLIEAYQNCVWTRRFRTFGECLLSVPYSEEALSLLKVEHILMQQNGNEAMYISTVNLTKDKTGADLINVTAYSFFRMLARRVVTKSYDRDDMTNQQIIKKLFKENVTAPSDSKRKMPYIELKGRSDYSNLEKTEFSLDAYLSLMDTLESQMEDSGLGCIITTSVTNKKHTFDFRLPTDKTASGSNPVIFSVDYGTLGEQEFTHSHDQYFNVAYVTGGDMESDDKAYKKVALQIVNDNLSGYDRRETLVNASDIQKEFTDDDGNKKTLTTAQVTKRLQKRGKVELRTSYKEESTFTGSIVETDSLVYRKDWDLGDKVTCAYNRWGIQADMVITEVTETYNTNGRSIEVTFGDGTPDFKKSLCALIRRT